MPVIASDVGGLKELIAENTGYLIGKDDIEGMAKKGIEILSDEDLKKFIGKNARKRVEESFDIDEIVPQYEKYYEEVYN